MVPVLVSFDLCPYVQRAAIALLEKGAPFERKDIDLSARPDWFIRRSPLGKVPLLLVGEATLFESDVIVEYLEETQPRPLHPADPLERARHRGWMAFASAVLADVWTIETSADPAAFEAARTRVADRFRRVEAALGAGPYFAGSAFTIVDAAFAPVFRYFDVFDRHRDLGAFDGLERVKAWRSALAERPSVRHAVKADYAERLDAFLRSRGGVFAAGMAPR